MAESITAWFCGWYHHQNFGFFHHAMVYAAPGMLVPVRTHLSQGGELLLGNQRGKKHIWGENWTNRQLPCFFPLIKLNKTPVPLAKHWFSTGIENRTSAQIVVWLGKDN